MSKITTSKLQSVFFGLVIANLISVPISIAFIESTKSQSLAAIDKGLATYRDEIAGQTGKELETALLASELAGEKYTIVLKTLESELVELGNPVISIEQAPTDLTLALAERSAVTVGTESEGFFRIRAIGLSDGEHVIVGSPLADHLQLLESAGVIRNFSIAVASMVGALFGLFTNSFQQNRLRLESVRKELIFEKSSQESMTKFLGDVSHELKTPLTVIRGYAELIAEKDKRNDKPVHRIVSEVKRMEILLNEMLTRAQLREAELQEPRDVELTSLLQKLVDDLLVMQRSRSVTYNYTEICFVKGGQLQIEMLFSNIFSNIRKHTPSDASVEVYLKRVGKQIIVTIEDAGEGLSEELMQATNQSIRRFETSRNAGVEGQGLGLAIIRGLAETCHGEAEFMKSEKLGGLKITIRLPSSNNQ